MTTKSETTEVSEMKLYRAAWRWHFFAGMFVIPFIIILTLSGAMMLISKPVEKALAAPLLKVTVEENRLSASTLLSRVEAVYPDRRVELYFPPAAPDQAARFSILSGEAGSHAGHGGASGASELVSVNPYSGDILGSDDPADTAYNFFKSIHGTLLLGDAGDFIIETVAGLAILMILSGLFLAWPRGGWKAIVPSFRLKTLSHWRSWHKAIGWLVAIPLLFFLISGLAWTNIWGGKLVQPWGSLPGTTFRGETAAPTHDSLNHHGVHEVPWTLEQTPMPRSAAAPAKLTVDDVVAIAEQANFNTYRIHFPKQHQGVWTISASTIAGDVQNPANERVMHIDQSDGRVLADIRFADYPLMGKAMAAFIPFHQGDLGLWNWLLNLVLLLLVMALVIAGATLWWKRNRMLESRLSPPPASPRSSTLVIGLMLLFSLLFPLSALAIVAFMLASWLYRRVCRNPGLRT
jgi:uncharacterized iron-regulated membrane protein